MTKNPNTINSMNNTIRNNIQKNKNCNQEFNMK